MQDLLIIKNEGERYYRFANADGKESPHSHGTVSAKRQKGDNAQKMVPPTP